MIITFEIPEIVANELMSDRESLANEALETFLVGLYRQRRITHFELQQALNLDAYDTDGILKKHDVSTVPLPDEVRAEATALRGSRPR